MSGIKYEVLAGDDLISALRGGRTGDLLDDAAYAAADEIESLRSRLAEETAIVDRIWDIYGRPTYEQLAGRSIYDLINADRARLAEAAEKAPHIFGDPP